MTEICILVHGFTGGPMEVEPLARALMSQGYEVVTPTLFGHDGSKDSLRKATATMWIQSVEPIVKESLHKYEAVHLIGFSMGAMICALIASEVPVTTLTLLAPAVYYSSPKHVFTHTATLLKATWNNRGVGLKAVKERVDKMSQVPLSSVRQFRRVVQFALRDLHKITIPTCILQGAKDLIVEPRGAQFVFDTIVAVNKEIHDFPKSGHMLCLDTEAGEVAKTVVAFLQNYREFTNSAK